MFTPYACQFSGQQNHARGLMQEKMLGTILTSEKVALQLTLTLQLLQLLSGLLGFGAIRIFLLHLLQKKAGVAHIF